MHTVLLHEILVGVVFGIFTISGSFPKIGQILIWYTGLEWMFIHVHKHVCMYISNTGFLFGSSLVHPPIHQVKFSADVSCHIVLGISGLRKRLKLE